MPNKFKQARRNAMAASAVPGILQAALQYYEKGDISKARAEARKALEIQPLNSDAYHILGICAYRSGEYAYAVEYYRSALKSTKSPFIYNNLGVALKESGRTDDAIEAYRQALLLKDDYAEAHCNMGNALREKGDIDQALRAYERSLRISPSNPGTLNNFGNALRDKGLVHEAINAYEDAIRLRPRFPDAYRNLGIAYKQLGRIDEAIEAYRKALALKPDHAEAHYNLGNALKERGDTDGAIGSFNRAVELKADYAEAYCNLGNALKEKGDIAEAADSLRRAVEIEPNFAEAWNNLGNALKDQGRITEAIGAYERAVAKNPALLEAHSNLIYAQQFVPGISLAKIAADHRQWNDMHGPLHKTPAEAFGNSRDPGKTLTLGFVGGHFRAHPVGYFVISIIEALAREDCRIICYANQKASDQLTERFRSASFAWRNILNLSDEEARGLILRDQIDILFDLTGHNEGNRLHLFARRSAPIQVTWAGYMATTGIDAMDYIIADSCEIWNGAEQYYTEKVIRMPDSFVCFDPPADAPPVSPLPALSKGHVTFGCFNILCKISPPVMELWRDILRDVPRSRLVLKTKELSCRKTGEYFLSLLIGAGIDPDRVDLVGRTSRTDHMAYYSTIDIALDTFPFSGSTTTLESLWMGIPVVTLPGETFAGRHSLSFLSTVGLTETIAEKESRYPGIAVELAHDIPRLVHLRSTLRGAFASSPLCDGPGFAKYLMKELRRVWSERCRALIDPSPAK